MSELTAVIVGAGRMGGTIDDEVRDYPGWALPYSHAAGYAEIEGVDLIALADLDESKVESLRKRYSVPRGYTDYKEMIEKEKPDIVSVTTPGTTHAQIAIFAAEHGAKGIYCEKGMACSLAEVDAMVEAVERNGVKFNMGTLRRWSAGANRAKALIDSGEIGATQTVISYSCGSLLHTASHFLDLLLYFADDAPVEWVQGTILNSEFDPSATRSDTDLSGIATIRFESGVWGHLMSAPLWAQFEVVCADGALRTVNDCGEWDLWKAETVERRKRYRREPFPEYEKESSTVRLIRDLVQAIETDGDTQQGVRNAAMTAEIAFGIIESHRQGGARVPLPIQNREFWMHSH